jgi:hypothetical protein
MRSGAPLVDEIKSQLLCSSGLGDRQAAIVPPKAAGPGLLLSIPRNTCQLR